MIDVVIIDDEQDCIDDLIYIFQKHKLEVKILATATSAKEGILCILEHKPQLVFLDIVMPGMSGFEMLALLPKVDFQLIITTSVDAYAIQAIRASALDFLLKPVKSSELIAAVQRSSHQQELPSASQINLLSDGMQNEKKVIKKIAVSISDGLQMIELDEVLYFESDGNYTTLFMQGDQKILVSKPIGKFEEMVDTANFFRVHNSYLINLNHVSKFIRSDGGYVILNNGKTISVARSKKEALVELLSKG